MIFAVDETSTVGPFVKDSSNDVRVHGLALERCVIDITDFLANRRQ